MENVLSGSKAIALIVTGLFVGSASWLIVEKRSNAFLENRLKNSESKMDSISTERDSLKNATGQFKHVVDTLLNKTDQLDKALDQAGGKLAAKNREVQRGYTALRQTKLDHDRLVASNSDLEKQFKILKTSCAQLQQDNKNLSNKAMLLADNNKLLNDELIKARQSSMDNAEVDALTKGGKLNPKARRVRKIVSTFSLQTSIKDPHFRFFDPTGKMLTEQDGTFTWHAVNSTGGPHGSEGSTSGITRIEVTYLPAKRLVPGLYSMETLNDNLHVGSLLVRFR